MAKRKQSGIEVVASMPWSAGIVIGLIGYFVLRHGMGWYLESSHNPIISGMGRMLANGVYSPFAWLFLLACWLAAIGSFIGRARRRKLLDSQTGIDSLPR